MLEISELSNEGGVRLSGELDLLTAERLAEVLRANPLDSQVVLDLSELTFVDSSGLAVLLGFADSLNGDGPLVLHDPFYSVQRVFEIVKLTEHPNIEVRYSKSPRRTTL